MPSDEAKSAYLIDYCEPVLETTLVLFSSRFTVTVIKVLHFIDGVKWYVGRHSSDFPKVYSRPALYCTIAGTSCRTWTLTGC